MKKVFGKLIRPTNRGVRILVGLLLVGLLVVQVSQSIATNEEAPAQLVTTSDGASIKTDDVSRLKRLQRLAETDHVALLEFCLSEFRKSDYPSYTYRFIKQEKIGGKLGKAQHIDVKFAPKPFSIAMKWVQNAALGDALVYVEGKHIDGDGRSQMVVRPKSKLLRKLTGGSVKRLPDGPDAMKNSLRPCTMFGFENGLKSLLGVYKLARQRGHNDERFGGFTKVDGRDCIVLERYLPQREDYPAKKTLTCIDIEYLVPLRVYGEGWDGKQNCNYEYHKVAFNAGLQAGDFTPQANGIKVK